MEQSRSGRSRIVLWVLVALAGAVVAGVLAMAWLVSFDNHPSLTTDMRSDALPTAAARVAFLSRYLKMRAPVTDASFHVVWHDNSGGLPGPSDWSIVCALRVSPADASNWLTEARPATPEELARASASASPPTIPPEWNVISTGAAYSRQGTFLRWHPEGVLELSASTH